MAEDHGAAEAGKLSRTWTSLCSWARHLTGYPHIFWQRAGGAKQSTRRSGSLQLKTSKQSKNSQREPKKRKIYFMQITAFLE